MNKSRYLKKIYFLIFINSLIINFKIHSNANINNYLIQDNKKYNKSCNNKDNSNCNNRCSDYSSSSSNNSCCSMSKSSDCLEFQNDCDNCKFRCSNDFAISRTIFIPRSLTPDSGLDLPLGNYQFYHNNPLFPEERYFFTFQASYFHLQSRKEYELAAYFLPNGRKCIDIKQDGTGDVGSLWLNIIAPDGNTFSSTICLSPRRTVNGGFLNFYFDFNNWICGTWLSIAFAVMRSEQTICIKEDSAEKNVIRALNNKDWTAGRFCPNKLIKTGVDDIQFKLGWNYYCINMDHIGLYFVATAPTGQRTRNRIIFEPVVGHRNGSAGVGFNSDFTSWVRGNSALNWMADLKYRYEFSYDTRRLFDLCSNGPWSRYLLVTTPDNPDISYPGVNYFVKQVKAATRSTLDFWTALHYHYCNLNLEIGYDLYWRDNERICFKSCNSENLPVGIYDLNGAALGDPVSASDANITETSSLFGTNYPRSDLIFQTVEKYDLNISSGSRPTAFTNTIYGGLSYNSHCFCIPYMLGFVAMYEFVYGNTAFEQWGVQVRTALSF